MTPRPAVLSVCLLLALTGCAGVNFAPESGGVEGGDGEGGGAVDGSLEVHVINVGQADATLLRTDEQTMLIDSGDWRDDGETVIDYLEAQGVDRIDHLVTTHGHADHIGGHEAVIDHYETRKDGVGAVYDSGVPHTTLTYERYLDAVERHDVDLFAVAQGDEIPFDGVAATVVNPEFTDGDDLHDDGVAIHLEFGETTFLFTGDAERDAESRMVDAHGETLEADVYQVGHHGSSTSSSPALLDTVDPSVAVVSSEYDDAEVDSRYGHPHEETLEAFAERDVRTAWTAVHGTVVFVSDGERISVRTQREVGFDPLELKGAGAASADPTAPTEERFVVEATAARPPVGTASAGVVGA